MNRLVIIISMLLLVACSTNKPVLNIQNEYVPTSSNGKQATTDMVEKAILSAAKKHGWNARIIKPGLIEASISVRQHRAAIEIPYSQSNYSIRYKSSENLDYSDGTIHRNYNKWINNLQRSIQQELGVNTQKY